MFSNVNSLAPHERLKLSGCGLLSLLLLRMADVCIIQSRNSTSISTKSWRLMMFDGALQRVAAVRGFAAPEGLVAVLKAVRPLLDDLRFAAAAAEHRHAIAAGHVRCRAELAWLLLWGRDGVPEDKQMAFRLAFEGAQQGCDHSCGVLAVCFAWGAGCVKDSSRAMQLASKSVAAGSRYGQYAMGRLHFDAQDDSRAAGLFRLAAAQRLDAAQWRRGSCTSMGMASIKTSTKRCIGTSLLWIKACRWLTSASRRCSSEARACRPAGRARLGGTGVLWPQGTSMLWLLYGA